LENIIISISVFYEKLKKEEKLKHKNRNEKELM